MRLIIMGPPGAGKGTQAAHIATRFGIPAISTGEIFRSNIKRGTELGKRVESIMVAGGYVPDELTNEIVEDRLAQADCEPGFLLDGYPRTTGQVEFLDELLARDGHRVGAVIELTVDEEATVQRLLDRAAVQGRADDNEETIRERMAIYHTETAPLTAIYADHGVLVRVDGMGEVDEVTDRIAAVLTDIDD